jgi:multicomponent Na+:H+ antiporter subunit E
MIPRGGREEYFFTMPIVRFAALYAFWIILSGRFEMKYLAIGVACAVLVTYLTQDLAQPEGASRRPRVEPAYFVLVGMGRFVLYLCWLLWSVLQSNFQVAYLVLHPKMPIQPGLLRLRTKLRNRTGHIMLANSITLTPGTITVDFDDGDYSVHALVPSAAQSLLDAKMQSQLERIFGEREEASTDIRWIEKPKE